MERNKVNATLLSVKGKRSYTSFIDKERFLIGKYTSVYDPTKAVRKFKKTHPHLKFGETTARVFCAAHGCGAVKEKSRSTSAFW